jgi:hypothetical protein
MKALKRNDVHFEPEFIDDEDYDDTT